MTILNCCTVRPYSPVTILPRLVLLPALHPDADPPAALLSSQPRAVPVMFPSVGAALAELRRLRDTYATGGQA